MSDPTAAGASPRHRESLALAALLALAAGLRLFDLGGVGFSGPEDYVVLAARGVLEHGAPLTPSGAVYPRALPYTYMVAASIGVFGDNEWAVRLPGVLLSVAAVAFTWALARLAFAAPVAWLAALALALCDWEISMARTARMYGPLSVAGLALVWLSARRVVHGPAVSLGGAIGVGLLAGALHRIAVLLSLPLALAPLLPGRPARERLRLALPLAALVVAGIAANVFTDHYYEPREALIASTERALPEPLEPQERARGMDSVFAAPLRVGVIALAAGAIGIVAWRAARLSPWLAFASAAAIAALALRLPLLAAYAWLGLALVAWRFPAQVGARALLVLALGIGAVSGGLGVLLLAEGVPVADAIRQLVLEPRNFLQLHALRRPGTFALALIAVATLLRAPSEDRRAQVGWLVAVAALLPMTVLGLHPTAEENFHERYAFFANPYLLVLAAAGAWWLAGRGVAAWAGTSERPALRAALAGVVLIASGGPHAVASLAAAHPHYGENRGLPSARGEPLFFADHAGTARFVCDHAGPRDRVAVTDSLGHALYCPRLDHQVTVRRDRDADHWLGGAKNRSSIAELLQALESDPGERVWFVVSQEERELRADAASRADLETLLEAHCVTRAHLSRDGVSAVYTWPQGCVGTSTEAGTSGM